MFSRKLTGTSSVVPIGNAMRERLNVVDRLPPLSQSRRQVLKLFLGCGFSQFARRRVAPGHQFIRLLLAANHPVMARSLVKRFGLKRHDIRTKRFFHLHTSRF